MKTAAIIRIIVWSAVALVLITLLLAGLFNNTGFGSNWLNFGGINMSIGGLRYGDYDNSSLYTVGGGDVDANNIKEIVIGWVDGRVNIETGVGNRITFEEQSSRVLDEKYKMRYYVSGDRLILQYCESRVSLIGIWRNLNKELTVTVPEGIELRAVAVDAVSGRVTYGNIGAERIAINNVSGGIDVYGANCNQLDLETVSGGITADSVNAGRVDASCVSGGINITRCSISDVDCETVSGGITVEPGGQAKRVQAQAVSGGLTVRIPENTGFTAKYSSMSGRFSCDFPVTMGNGSALYLDGGMEIDLESVSGRLSVEKAY